MNLFRQWEKLVDLGRVTVSSTKGANTSEKEGKAHITSHRFTSSTFAAHNSELKAQFNSLYWHVPQLQQNQ